MGPGMRTLATVVACLLVGLAIGTRIPRALELHQPGDVTVRAPERVEAERPRTIAPGLGERLTTKAIAPDQVVRGSSPSVEGKRRVEAYCRPLPPEQLTGPRPASSPLALELRKSAAEISTAENRTLPDFGGRRQGSRLTLYSTLSDGTPWSAVYRVRGRAAWLSSGDSAAVRGDRLAVRVVRGAPRCGLLAAAQAAIGLLAGLRPHELPLPTAAALLACAL
jgi:hypothetical protein